MRADGGIVEGSPPRAWVSLGVKINRGNYQSLDVSLGLSRDVSQERTPEQEFDQLFQIAAEQLSDKVSAMLIEYPIE